jgi:hypothetical protein
MLVTLLDDRKIKELFSKSSEEYEFTKFRTNFYKCYTTKKSWRPLDLDIEIRSREQPGITTYETILLSLLQHATFRDGCAFSFNEVGFKDRPYKLFFDIDNDLEGVKLDICLNVIFNAFKMRKLPEMDCVVIITSNGKGFHGICPFITITRKDIGALLKDLVCEWSKCGDCSGKLLSEYFDIGCMEKANLKWVYQKHNSKPDTESAPHIPKSIAMLNERGIIIRENIEVVTRHDLKRFGNIAELVDGYRDTESRDSFALHCSIHATSQCRISYRNSSPFEATKEALALRPTCVGVNVREQLREIAQIRTTRNEKRIEALIGEGVEIEDELPEYEVITENDFINWNNRLDNIEKEDVVDYDKYHFGLKSEYPPVINTDLKKEVIKEILVQLHEKPGDTKSIELSVTKIFNRHFAYLKKTGSVVQRSFNGCGEIIPVELTVINFHNSYKNVTFSNKVIDPKNKKRRKEIIVQMTDCWMKHPFRRDYESIGFCPYPQSHPLALNNKLILNTYDGIMFEKYWENVNEYPNLKLISYMNQSDEEDRIIACRFAMHTLRIICNHKYSVFVQLCRILAAKLKFPWMHIKKVIVLRGHQGNGKSMWVEAILEAFGRHKFVCHNTGASLGAFNGEFLNRLAIFFDEVHFPGDIQSNNIFKNLVTQETIMLHQKYRTPETIRNHTLLFASSNCSWVFRADGSERRYFPLQTAHFRIENDRDIHNEHFTILNKMSRNDWAPLRLWILSLFKCFDDFNEEEAKCVNSMKLPTTCLSFMREQKVFSANSATLYWQTVLKRGWTVSPYVDCFRADRIAEHEALYLKFIDLDQTGRIEDEDIRLKMNQEFEKWEWIGKNGCWLGYASKYQIYSDFKAQKPDNGGTKFQTYDVFWGETLSYIFPCLSVASIRVVIKGNMVKALHGEPYSTTLPFMEETDVINLGTLNDLRMEFVSTTGLGILEGNNIEKRMIQDEEDENEELAKRLINCFNIKVNDEWFTDKDNIFFTNEGGELDEMIEME